MVSSKSVGARLPLGCNGRNFHIVLVGGQTHLTAEGDTAVRPKGGWQLTPKLRWLGHKLIFTGLVRNMYGPGDKDNERLRAADSGNAPCCAIDGGDNAGTDGGEPEV